MQRLLTVLLLAAMATVVSKPALAGNQEVADQIARTLQESGKLSNYKIEVQYQQGVARLKGHVRSQSQMNTALRVAIQTAGVNRVVNELTVSSPAAPRAAAPELGGHLRTPPQQPDAARPVVRHQPRSQRTNAVEWLKKIVVGEDRQQKPQVQAQPADGRGPNRAQRVPSSFTNAPVKQVAGTQPVAAAQPVVAEQPVVATQPVAPVRTLPQGTIPRHARRPIPVAYTQAPGGQMPGSAVPGGPIPAYVARAGGGVAPARYDQPHLPKYSWPSYAAYPNYAALTYPRQYSPTAWPYIGPFYPYPQVPLGWRKVTLEWDDGWWMLDFRNTPSSRR
ncbi:MAG: BON domain-containing protein [Planctomycetota bacterium]|jgi:hypothetical protein